MFRMGTHIYKNRVAFCKRKNKKDNGVSPEFAREYPHYQNMNRSNEGCWNCAYCYDCRDCDSLTGSEGSISLINLNSGIINKDGQVYE